jgi:antitoxin CcdA
MTEAPRQIIGSRIKQAREQAGLSQNALAGRVGITAAAVALWETARSQPTSDKLPMLAKSLGVSSAWLLGEVTGRLADAPQPSKGSAPISIDPALTSEALDLGIDVTAVVDRHLRQVVAEARQRRWLVENRSALADANAFLDRYGLWSDGKRLF